MRRSNANPRLEERGIVVEAQALAEPQNGALGPVIGLAHDCSDVQ